MQFKFLNESMLNLLDKFNLNIDDYLTESKADELRLIDYAGEDLAKRFLAIRKRLKSPSNDLYFWIKSQPVEAFRAAIEEVENTLSNTQLKKSADAGAEFVGSNEDWKVYHITTFEASQKYGRDTKWCITGVDGYGRKYWDDYTKTGVDFYFFISKGKINPRGRYGKYALALSPKGDYQVYDQQDNEAYGVPNAPHINGLPDLRTVEVDHYVFDGKEVPENINRTTIKTIDIDENVTDIRFAAFYDFASLTKVVIPNNVIKVGPCAFRGCTSLKSVIISDGVRTLEDAIFYDCPNLETITIPPSVTEISPKLLFGCENVTICCQEGSRAEQFAKDNNINILHTEGCKI